MRAARAALTDPSNPVRVLAISGDAGSGKTALAVELAWDVRKRFPDGCVWLRLAELGGPRTPWDDVAVTLLGAIKQSAPSGHVTGSDMAELNDLLHRRRMLVVLDDVEDEGQVIDVLPHPGSKSAMVVLSRTALANLPGRPSSSGHFQRAQRVSC